MRTLRIEAKCSDCCSALLVIDGKLVRDHDGYVPKILSGSGGDYVSLEIDIDTGQILNWTVPTEDQIKKFIEGDDA